MFDGANHGEREMKEGKELYKPGDLPAGTHVEPCPVCGADAQLWQYSTDFKTGPIEKVLMCSNGEKFGPQDGLTNEGCLLYMPPQDFYRGRIAEAVKFWNEYAKALNAQRRDRNWKRAKVLREVPPNAVGQQEAACGRSAGTDC